MKQSPVKQSLNAFCQLFIHEIPVQCIISSMGSAWGSIQLSLLPPAVAKGRAEGQQCP